MSGLKTCSATFSLLDGSSDPEMVDSCASMVDPSRAVSADSPTNLMGLVPLVDALLLSNPKPILKLEPFKVCYGIAYSSSSLPDVEILSSLDSFLAFKAMDLTPSF
ncbi:hypothetical protein Tco_0411630 [Tanacetum coccineum]